MRLPTPPWVGAFTGAISALVIFGPLMRPGFVLTYDMVFVPDPRLDAATLGIDGSVPRAVPTDAVVGLLGAVLPGDVVQKVLLLLFPVLLGAGVGRLAASRAAAVASATLAIWNPYVAERLLIGHWPYLLGWAVLPWVVRAAADLRKAGPRGTPVLGLWLCAAAMCGATPGLLALTTALVVVGWPGSVGRRWPALASVSTIGLAVNAVWLWPAFAVPGGIPVDPNGVAAFAARSDTPLGLLPSLITFGGIWNPASVPPQRGSATLGILAVGLTVGVLVYGRQGLSQRRDLPGAALFASGFGSLALAAAAATPGLEAVMRAIIVAVPGGGLLRDGQKLITPFLLLVVICAGESAHRLRSLPGPQRRGVGDLVTMALVVLPLFLSLALASQLGGRLGTVAYPAEWVAMRETLVGMGNQRLVELPWNAYRRYGWNSDRVVLNPGPRYWPYGSVVSDDLPLSHGVVRGESSLARAIGAAVVTTDPEVVLQVLRSEGVGLVVVDASQAGANAMTALVASYPVVAEHGSLVLYRVPGVAAPAPGVAPIRPVRAVGLMLALSALVALVATGIVSGRGTRDGGGTAGGLEGSSPASVSLSADHGRRESG